jgi:UDP-N-acetylglucosamine--N-acetylmuramyl-(pentapeptide) pyrophosphoryl-undecaprenol N-acetylglucosamine transferase
MEQAGAAVVVPDGELDGPRLAREVAALIGSPARLRTMAAAAREVARPDAAQTIARLALELSS